MKKELFRLVVLPCFYLHRSKSFHVDEAMNRLLVDGWAIRWTDRLMAGRLLDSMKEGMGRISYNGALCIGNLNRMCTVDGVKWVGLHCYHQDIL